MKLIGRHDAVFLFVVYSIFAALFTLVDACSKPDIRLAANGWYLVWALYAFGKLMEHKQAKWLPRFSFLTVLIFLAVHISLLGLQKKTEFVREGPLFVAKVINETIAANATAVNATSEIVNVTNVASEVVTDL